MARLGTLVLGGFSQAHPYEDHFVRKIVAHGQYDYGRSVMNDIALLELAEPVLFKKHIVPICLPRRAANFAGKVASVSGSGKITPGDPLLTPSTDRARVLRSVDVPVLGHEVCHARLDEIDRKKVHFDETKLCTGLDEPGKGPCKGDSGSPLALEENGRVQLIGLVSLVYGCGTQVEKAPSIFTNVSSFIEWIEINMASEVHPNDHVVMTRLKSEYTTLAELFREMGFKWPSVRQSSR